MSLTKILVVPILAGLLAVSAAGVANAAPSPSFQFGLSLGDNGDNNYDPTPDDSCSTDNEIYSDLRSQGYRHLRPVDDSGDTLTIDAVRGGRFYELEVDSCSGDIQSRTRLFHHW